MTNQHIEINHKNILLALKEMTQGFKQKDNSNIYEEDRDLVENLIERLENKSIVTFSKEHNIETPHECQVFIAISGSENYVYEKLQEIINSKYTQYGKPIQGVLIGNGIVDVITPKWNNKKY